MNIYIRKVKNPSNKDNFFNLKKISWNEKDKKILLAALKTYGHTDIKNISREFPHKSKIALKAIIKKLRLAAEKCATKRENQIHIWLNSNYFNESDTVIPQALKFISMFEKHLPLEETARCNFKVLYDILSKAIDGVSPVDVSQMTCRIISYILLQVTHEIWPLCESDICEYIDDVERDKMKNNYKPKKKL